MKTLKCKPSVQYASIVSTCTVVLIRIVVSLRLRLMSMLIHCSSSANDCACASVIALCVHVHKVMYVNYIRCMLIRWYIHAVYVILSIRVHV